MHTSKSAFRASAAVLLAAALVVETIATYHIGGRIFSTGVNDIGQALAALLAGVACAVAAARTRDSIRLGWTLLAVASLSWAGGECVWSYIEVWLGQAVPSPSAADVGFLLMVPFGFGGVFVFAAASSHRSEGLRALVDGLLIASSLLFVSWETILRGTFASSSLSILGKLVNLSYPVSDVAMITIVVVALTRVNRSGRAAIGLLGAGFIFIAVSDSAFVYLTATNSYTGNALDGGWVAGYLLIALASLRAGSMKASSDEERFGWTARTIASYAAILLAVVAAAVLLATEGELDRVAIRIAGAIACFSIISQLLVIIENRRLPRQSRDNEQSLQESRRSLEQVIDNAPVVLFSVDAAGVLTLATGHALKAFGEGAVHLVGRNVHEILKQSPAFLAAIQQGLLGKPAQLVAAFEHGDLDVRLLPVWENGLVVSVSGVGIDVSERRRAEQVRRESEAKSRFLATMSHELRTPLNSVLGFAELLNGQHRGQLNQAQQRYVANIAAGGQHLLALINDVLDLSRVASGEIEIALCPVLVADVIAQAVAKIRPLAARKRLSLTVQAAGRPQAIADPLRLQQIVLNLLSNAVKFTPEGGQIRVRARHLGEVVEVEVSDNGIGIASEHIGLIFEEYSMVDDSYNRKQEGTGLGLAVSRRLAELMAATLTVESTVGSGSVFRLRLQAISVVPAEHPAGGGQRQGSPDGKAEEITVEAAQG